MILLYKIGKRKITNKLKKNEILGHGDVIFSRWDKVKEKFLTWVETGKRSYPEILMYTIYYNTKTQK